MTVTSAVNDRDALLRLGYFPKELPPTFHTRDFADFISRKGSLELSGPKGHAKISSAATHSLARPGQLRRLLKVFNPFNQYEVADTIVKGWGEIDKHLQASELSVSRPIRDNRYRRAFRTEKTGNDLPFIRADRRSAGRYLLSTDIARFYHTTYTHSIPWALQGKSQAKKNRTSGLGNDLDRALRNGQDGQTVGIPVGPDTSLIIAEIVAASVDMRLQELTARGFRFVDDFEFVVSNQAEAETTLAKIEQALGQFELAINPLKTRIELLPQPLERGWTAKIREYEIGSNDEVSKKDLLKYFNVAFQLSNEHPGEPVIPYSVGRLRSIKVQEGAWEDYQNLLFQCAVAEPSSLPTVLGQPHHHQSWGVSDRLEDVITEVITVHAPLNHASEVAWALWTAIWYQIELPKQMADAVAVMDDGFVSLLALDAWKRGILPQNLGRFWADRITGSDNLYNGNWLLMYEGHLQGWLSGPGKSEVSRDPNFGQLFSERVSFYDQHPDTPVAYLIDLGYGEVQDISDERDSDF